MPAAALPDYPFASHYLNVAAPSGNAINLHYLDESPTTSVDTPTPPPVLMLHGNPTWSYFYRKLILALRGTCRTIVPDHIGMGRSDKPTDAAYSYTLDRRVDDLERLIDSLNLTQPLTLVLHDWGGMIGMAYATRHPERIARIVVLNTGAFALPANKKLPWQIAISRTPLLGALLIRGLNGFSRGAVRDCVKQPLPAEVAQAFIAPYDSWANRRAVHRFIQDIPLKPGDRAYNTVANVEEKLRQFQNLPMLICWGMQDFVFDIHFLNRWIELFPQAEVHRFPEAGHYVLEDASAQIIPLVQNFFAAHPLKAAPQ